MAADDFTFSGSSCHMHLGRQHACFASEAVRRQEASPGKACKHYCNYRANCTHEGRAGQAAVPPGPAAILGGGLAPAVDWGTALGRGDAGAGLLVAVAPTVAKGGLGLLAEVSTFSGSRGLRTAACRTFRV